MTRSVRISTPSRSARARASAFGRTLKPTTRAFDAAARLTSPSVMPPTPRWMTRTRTSGCWIFCSSRTGASRAPADDAHAHLRVLDLLQLRDGGFDRPVDVALEDEVEILDATLLHLGEELLERDAGAGGRGKLLASQALAPVLGEMVRAALVLDDTCHL